MFYCVEIWLANVPVIYMLIWHIWETLLPEEVALLWIVHWGSFSHGLVEALQKSLAFGPAFVGDYSKDDQCLFQHQVLFHGMFCFSFSACRLDVI